MLSAIKSSWSSLLKYRSICGSIIAISKSMGNARYTKFFSLSFIYKLSKYISRYKRLVLRRRDAFSLTKLHKLGNHGAMSWCYRYAFHSFKHILGWIHFSDSLLEGAVVRDSRRTLVCAWGIASNRRDFRLPAEFHYTSVKRDPFSFIKRLRCGAKCSGRVYCIVYM